MKLRKILAAAVVLFIGAASVLPLADSAEEYTWGQYESLTYTKYDNHVEIHVCDSSVEGEVVIPAEIEGLPVTVIEKYAFYYCNEMTGVIIPDSIVSIGDNAFYHCRSLTVVTIPEGVTSLGDNVFSLCDNLAEIKIPESVVSIGNLAFSNTKWLEDRREEAPLVTVNNILVDWENCEGDIVIPDGITGIAGHTFALCSGITSVTLPDSLTSIGERAFAGCTGLTEITIPESVTSFGEYAFVACDGLTSVTLPESLTSIENGMFEGCAGLKSIKIPDSVTKIGDQAFMGCFNLTSVTVPESVKSIGAYCFACCKSLGDINILSPDCRMYDVEVTICSDFDYIEEEDKYISEFYGTIVGHEGSTAQAYAEKYGYDFKTLSEYENAVPVSEDEGIIVETGDDKGYKGFPVIPLAFLGAGTTIILVGVLSLAKKRKKN